jgi:hypothetical protein
MDNSRLLALLRTLSRSELRDLSRFVQTPFFNQRKEVHALLDLLLPHLLHNKPLPDKATLQKALFEGNSANDQRVRMAMTFLYQLTGQFLVMQDIADNPADLQLRLAQILRTRNLPDHAQQAREEAQRRHQQRPFRNPDYQQQTYELLLEQHRADVSAAQPIPVEALQELTDQLQYTYLSRFFWQACFVQSYSTRTSERPAVPDLVLQLTQYVSQHPDLLQVPALAVYYWCYRMMQEPEEETYFAAFKALIRSEELQDQFSAEEWRDLYILAVNFCIRAYNEGNTAYRREQFDFYRVGLDRGYFLTEGQLSHLTYLNVATVALTLNELDWVEAFINRCTDLLRPQYREPLSSFNLARLAYRKRDFRKALRHLQRADYRDVLLYLAAKTLQLKIYYESDEFDLLMAHLQAMQTFVSRKKATLGYQRDNYLALIRFTRKLLETNLLDRDLRAALRLSIEQTKSVAEKEWLLEQVR